MAEGVVAIVIEGFGNFLIQQGKFLSGVSDQVKLAQNELLLMQGFLKDADARKEKDEVVGNWVNIIRDSAYDLEDVIESFVLKMATKKIILKRFACNIMNPVYVFKIGSEIEKITTTLSGLRLSMQSYKIREEPRGSGAETSFQRLQDQRQSYAHEIDRDIVGLEEDAELLVGHLVKEEKRHQTVSIWGMGGLGKTTLARQVYHHDAVKRYFDCFAWVCISQQCHPNDVLKDIFNKLTSATSEEKKSHNDMKKDEIAEKLCIIQKERKCLVVLDDMWTISQWNSMKSGFPVNEETGSRILLTTRKKDVTLHDGYIHEGRPLNPNESWELFERIAISGREDNRDSEIYAKKVDLGRQMVQHCAGLPLAIKVLAGFLSKKDTVDDWDKVHDGVNAYISRGTDLKQEYKGQDYQGTLWVLKLSYDDLPFRLKLCFLYLAHFPEDYEIPVKRLTQLWIAEGFISSTTQRRGSVEIMEDVSYNCVIELVERCMVQVEKYGSTKKIKTCCLHDLMRELCVSMAKEENFLHSIQSSDMITYEAAPIGKVRRLAIYMDTKVGNKVGPIADGHLIRSLLCFGSYGLEKLLRSFFNDFKFLRILKIEDKWETVELPSAIGNLVHLRFISLKNSRVKRLPSSIAKLVSLQTLDLRCLIGRKRIPNVIGKMEQLRHLYLTPLFLYGGVRGKLKLDCLGNLQTLVNVKSSDCDLKDLAKLTNLRKLSVDVSSLKNLEVEALEEMLKSTSITFSRLQSLSVSSDEGVILSKIVLSCCRIYKLEVEGPMAELPGDLMCYPNLTKLTLNGTHLKDDQIEVLEKLPKLRMLFLYMSDLPGTLNCSRGGFPHLEFLSLTWMHRLKEWTVEEGAMPSLCTLHIVGCRKLTQVPDGLKYITTLKELTIKWMSSEFCNKLGEGGDDFYKIQHVPSVILWPDDD